MSPNQMELTVKRWMLGVVALFSAGLSAQSAVKPRLATSAENAVVLIASRDVLKDPDSAKVTNLLVKPDASGGLAFCGFLNAKNSYGGYTGGQLFAGKINTDAAGKPVSARIDGMDDGNTYAGSLACKTTGFGD